ncbi:hypothetical protein ACQUW5_15220, partial [Legionella sp. CNM-1927-20]|uniref:hypothetical protein n=1 Tax=Legionella sp. CNM-1927-20 TaxID=3422221 RepID=UPI00403AD98A
MAGQYFDQYSRLIERANIQRLNDLRALVAANTNDDIRKELEKFASNELQNNTLALYSPTNRMALGTGYGDTRYIDNTDTDVLKRIARRRIKFFELQAAMIASTDAARVHLQAV